MQQDIDKGQHKMKIVARFRVTALTLASAGLLLPPTAVVAAEPSLFDSPATAAADATVQDVELTSDGVLEGQVLDPQGFPVAEVPVTVWASGHEIASAQTDAEGTFTVPGLHGGSYTVTTGQSSAVYRLWAKDTAPPHATTSVLIVGGQDVARGQGGVFRGPFWPPRTTTIAIGLFLGGIIAGGLIGQQNGSGS